MKIKYYISLFVLLSFLSTCKKFPEDPFISINTVKERLKGNWRIDKIIYFGDDIKSLYKDSLQPYSIDNVVVKFAFDYETTIKKSSSYYDKYNPVNIYSTEGYTSFTTTLKFYLVSKKIQFTEISSASPRGKFNKLFLENPDFEIKKLYNKVLKITNDRYQILLSKVK
ncbi:MAG: hypothetical protein H0U95_01890 [Bacteroidetes bacterium]|nr:hypothetical protein [Bacteroidota bacterium]